MPSVRIEVRSHPNQARGRLSLHFAHDMSAMNLNRVLRDSQLGRRLFIQQTTNQERKHLLLAGCQRTIALEKICTFVSFSLGNASHFESMSDGRQKHALLNRLRKEVNRTFLHRLYGRRNVTAASDEDDRYHASLGI